MELEFKVGHRDCSWEQSSSLTLEFIMVRFDSRLPVLFDQLGRQHEFEVEFTSQVEW